MKNKYNTPEIKVEILAKTDVLCDSGDSSETVTQNGKYNVEFSSKNWTIEDLL